MRYAALLRPHVTGNDWCEVQERQEGSVPAAWRLVFEGVFVAPVQYPTLLLPRQLCERIWYGSQCLRMLSCMFVTGQLDIVGVNVMMSLSLSLACLIMLTIHTGWVARFGSACFLCVQILMLLDFVTKWNDTWVDKEDER